jgi:hypothetical protein
VRRLLLLAVLFPAACSAENPDLYKPPAPIVRPTLAAQPPPKKRPTPPTERRLSDEDAQALLSRIYALYLQPRGGQWCSSGESWLSLEVETHLLEVRLFSGAFPELAASTALHVLEDADADLPSLYFARYLLGRHHQKADARLEATIADLAEDPREEIHSWAIALMGWSPGRRSRYRYHLWSHAAKGRRDAFRALAQDDFDDTVAFLRNLQLDGRFPELCAEALDRIAMLRSPDRDRRLETLLRSPRTPDYNWALTAAWERCRPLLLRVSMDELVRYRKDYEPALLREESPGNPETPYERSFSRRFLWSTCLPEVSEDFDRILVQVAELGGELTPLERQRLENFGFLGNLEDRLLDHMHRRQQFW